MKESKRMIPGPNRKDFRVQKVVQVLNRDPSYRLPELANGCQISVSRLSHLFKDELGVNVKNYRRDCRLQVAAAMLISTRMTVKEIAYAARYRHPSSFVRAFKIHYGLSPARYRELKLAAGQQLI
jgi:AraC family transcriptional regulator of arabinose operon